VAEERITVKPEAKSSSAGGDISSRAFASAVTPNRFTAALPWVHLEGSAYFSRCRCDHYVDAYPDLRPWWKRLLGFGE